MEDNTYIDDIMIDEYLDTFPEVWEEVIVVSIDDLIEHPFRTNAMLFTEESGI